jgi:formate dehydrogenase major subunit
LIDRVSAYRGRDTQVEHHKTICTACSVGCGMDVLTRDNQIMRIEGDWEAAVNDGVICKFGRFLPLDEKRTRINTPMVRENGALKPATWEKAIQTLAEKLGKGSAAAIASTRLSVEALHLFKQLFADSDMATSLEEGLETSAAAVAAEELGQPFEGKLEDILHADLLLILGADLVEAHQVAGFFVKRSLPTGVKLVVVEQGGSALKDLADVMLTPASADAAVPALAAALSGSEVALVAAAAGAKLNLEDLRKAGSLIKAARRAVILLGKEVTTPAAVKALVELAKAGKAVILSLKGSGNSLAASQLHLDRPFKLNGHQSVFVALGDDEPTQRLIQRLEKAPFLAVQAAYASQLTAKADVVLPVTMWAEESGHFLNLEGRLQEAVVSLTPAEGLHSNVDAFKALARQLGRKVNDQWETALKERVAPAVMA